MQLIACLTIVLALLCTAQAYIYHIGIETGRCHPFYLRGKTTVELHGPFNTEEIVFEKELITSYGSLTKRNFDFPDKQILKVVVTWNTDSKDDIAVMRAVIYSERTHKQPIYVPTNSTSVTLKNGESVTLVRDD